MEIEGKEIVVIEVPSGDNKPYVLSGAIYVRQGPNSQKLTTVEEMRDFFSVCKQTYFGKLLHNIREDKSYFDGIIDPKDVSSVYAVKPKLDNPRISKQHGAFLIFGISPSLFTVFGLYKPMAKFNKKWIERGSDSGQRIIIDKKSKTQILQQLESFGFNQATLFPEVDKVASFVKFKYLKKLD